MLKVLFSLIKLVIFTVLILMIGNWVKYDGKTISDQIKTGLAHAERSDVSKKVRGWATGVIEDAKLEVERAQEEISQTEREKLRELIKELNQTEQAKK